MNDLSWLLLANAVVWLGLGAWLLRLHRAGANLAKRLCRLENNRHVDKKTQTPQG